MINITVVDNNLCFDGKGVAHSAFQAYASTNGAFIGSGEFRRTVSIKEYTVNGQDFTDAGLFLEALNNLSTFKQPTSSGGNGTGGVDKAYVDQQDANLQTQIDELSSGGASSRSATISKTINQLLVENGIIADTENTGNVNVTLSKYIALMNALDIDNLTCQYGYDILKIITGTCPVSPFGMFSFTRADSGHAIMSLANFEGLEQKPVGKNNHVKTLQVGFISANDYSTEIKWEMFTQIRELVRTLPTDYPMPSEASIDKLAPRECLFISPDEYHVSSGNLFMRRSGGWLTSVALNNVNFAGGGKTPTPPTAIGKDWLKVWQFNADRVGRAITTNANLEIRATRVGGGTVEGFLRIALREAGTTAIIGEFPVRIEKDHRIPVQWQLCERISFDTSKVFEVLVRYTSEMDPPDATAVAGAGTLTYEKIKGIMYFSY